MNSDVLDNNKAFWSLENSRKSSDGMLLYENFDDTLQLCYGISKVALCIAKSLNLTPAVLLPWRKSKMTESMCQTHFQMKNSLPRILCCHFLSFLYIIFLMTRRSLLDYRRGHDIIGTYIYDGLLRRQKKKTIAKLTIKERLFICEELCYYYYFKRILKDYPIKAVVLGDEVYRYGLLYELCKNNGILCFSPVNMNTVFVRKQATRSDFVSNYLTTEILKKLCDGVDVKTKVDQYFSNRYSGNIQQHDVLSAYANKKVTGKEEFIKKYNLDTNKKTVIVTSHVFADAPHVYTDALYDDYWEWFVNTCNCLISNPHINLLVKEHPSAHLYGEKGLVRDFLSEKGLGHLQIREDESTLSILENVDAVVTCGGTIGMEISYFGKYVILASKPPYSGLGFSKEFSSKREYEDYLKYHVQEIDRLTDEQREMAIKASYALFCRADNWSEKLELGGEIVYMGRKYNNDAFYANIMRYNEVPLKEQHIYNLIDVFVHSDNKQLFSKV